MCPKPFSKQFLDSLSIKMDDLKQTYNENIPPQVLAGTIKFLDTKKEIDAGIDIDENFASNFLKMYKQYTNEIYENEKLYVSLHYAISSSRLVYACARQHIQLENDKQTTTFFDNMVNGAYDIFNRWWI